MCHIIKFTSELVKLLAKRRAERYATYTSSKRIIIMAGYLIDNSEGFILFADEFKMP